MRDFHWANVRQSLVRMVPQASAPVRGYALSRAAEPRDRGGSEGLTRGRRPMRPSTRAASITARGASVHSDAPSRKEDRKPCETAPTPQSRRSPVRSIAPSKHPHRGARRWRRAPSAGELPACAARVLRSYAIKSARRQPRRSRHSNSRASRQEANRPAPTRRRPNQAVEESLAFFAAYVEMPASRSSSSLRRSNPSRLWGRSRNCRGTLLVVGSVVVCCATTTG